jgi:hypothetical protein
MNNKAVWHAMLRENRLSEPEAELLCTAALSCRDSWLLESLWKRWDTLGEGTQDRLSTAEACIMAATLMPGLLERPVMANHTELAVIAAAVADNVVRDVDHFANGETRLGCVLKTCLELGDDDSCVTLLLARPRLMVGKRFLGHDSAMRVLAKLICGLEMGGLSKAATGGSVLACLEALEAKGSDEQRGGAEGLMAFVAIDEGVAALLAEHPDYLNAALVRAWADPAKQVAALIGRIFDSDKQVAGKVVKLLDCNDKEVARLVLPGDSDEFKALVGRKAGVVANELQGDMAAQELFWALAAEWVGSVAELIEAARKLTSEGEVVHRPAEKLVDSAAESFKQAVGV